MTTPSKQIQYNTGTYIRIDHEVAGSIPGSSTILNVDSPREDNWVTA